MNRVTVLLFALINAAAAAPAVVWKSAKESRGFHSSSDVQAAGILSDVLSGSPDDSALAAVVFLVGRSKDGSESFSKLAADGLLPGIASKYDDADVYHHVSGIASAHSVVQDAARSSPGHRVLEVTLDEFSSKLASHSQPVEAEVSAEGGMLSKAQKAASKRSRALASSNVFIVNVAAHTDPAKLDSAVVSAIESASVGNVVVAGIRSTDEVKHERDLVEKRRMLAQQKAGQRVLAAKSRRLEDVADDDKNQQDYQSDVYFVSMTPNILAGILFFFLFALIAYIGIGCMGMIQGQDVYVNKMPSIGREA